MGPDGLPLRGFPVIFSCVARMTDQGVGRQPSPWHPSDPGKASIRNMDTKQDHTETRGPGWFRRTMATVLTVSAGCLAGLIRLVPHPVNFSPVGALGLFGGARLRLWQALALPVGVMAITDYALWLLSGMDPLYSP